MKFKLLPLISLFCGAALFSVAMSSPAIAATADETEKPVKVRKHKTKAAKRQLESTQNLYGSSETQKMRDKRLSRECKGAANGGACRGYTQ